MIKLAWLYLGAAVERKSLVLSFLGMAALRKKNVMVRADVSSLLLFASLLTFIETDAAGRAYQINKGINIATWLTGFG